MRGTRKPFERRYAGEQRQAIFRARFELAMTYQEIERRAASGELVEGQPFPISWQVIGNLCRQEERRRRGRFDSKLADMPHRDAIEELRRAALGVAEDLMVDLRAISEKRPRDVDPKRLQELIKQGPADHSVALWAGLTALFSNLAALELLELFGEESRRAQAVASLGTALIVAAAVYSKERLSDAKAAQRKRARRPRNRNDPH
jgi:hypothetical protein